MNTKIKRGLFVSVWIILLAGIGLLLFFIQRHKKSQTCNTISVIIENTEGNHFVDSALVMDIIGGARIIGETIDSIDAGAIESLLENNPFVKNTEVYKAVDGSLNVRIWQKRALLRVFNSDGESFYIDEDDHTMPLSENFTARVMVCNGNIADKYIKCDTIGSSTLKTCCSIAHFVNKSVFWTSMIEQIFVSADNTIRIIPKMGNEQIILGDGADLDEKFNKLFTFYKQALPKVGWEKYKIIDASYKNQIVAKK